MKVQSPGPNLHAAPINMITFQTGRVRRQSSDYRRRRGFITDPEKPRAGRRGGERSEHPGPHDAHLRKHLTSGPSLWFTPSITLQLGPSHVDPDAVLDLQLKKKSVRRIFIILLCFFLKARRVPSNRRVFFSWSFILKTISHIRAHRTHKTRAGKQWKHGGKLGRTTWRKGEELQRKHSLSATEGHEHQPGEEIRSWGDAEETLRGSTGTFTLWRKQRDKNDKTFSWKKPNRFF